jgi:hypothetical protein
MRAIVALYLVIGVVLLAIGFLLPGPCPNRNPTSVEARSLWRDRMQGGLLRPALFSHFLPVSYLSGNSRANPAGRPPSHDHCGRYYGRRAGPHLT